jgi:hypothetical protein
MGHPITRKRKPNIVHAPLSNFQSTHLSTYRLKADKKSETPSQNPTKDPPLAQTPAQNGRVQGQTKTPGDN